MRTLAGELARFAAVGTVGFGVDAGITLALSQMLQWSAQGARLPAFLIAATLTWALNRRFTFRSTVGPRSWLPYAALSSLGALINYGVYLAWLRFAGYAPGQILLGIFFGAAVALQFNFTISRRLIFSRQRPTGHS